MFDSLVHLLEVRAGERPDRLAYTFLRDGEVEEANLSYGELACAARAVGAWLQERKLQNQNVLLLYPPGLEYIVAFWGCLYAGAVAVPAYPPSRNRHLGRIEAIVADAKPQLALTTATIRARIESSLACGVTEEIDPELAKNWRVPHIDHSTLAFLQYTSGSTATPKGVMVTHGNLLHNEELIRRAFHQNEHSIIAGWLPLYHDMGLIGNVLQPLYLGARCILMSPISFLQQPLRWLRAISDYRATTSGGPNFAYDLCTQKISVAERDSLDLTSWSVAFNGAEPVRAETLHRFAEFFEPCGFRREAFYPCYGLAEATLFVSGASGPSIKTSVVGCGALEHDPEVVIVNPETFVRCAPGEEGEIWISGPSVAAGYWNQPEETASVFHARLADGDRGPYLRSGDLGFVGSDELFITGRIKDLIIIRGRNLYPHEIERTVEKSHPSLKPGCGAAFSIADEGEERLVIVQELARRASSSFDDVLGNIRQAVVEEHEVQPYCVVLVSAGSVPKTSSGKIQRGRCRELFLSSRLEVIASWQANKQTVLTDEGVVEVETVLRSHLAAKLGVDPESIDVHAPLTRYGIDSLSAIEMAHAIESNFNVEWSMASLLEGPSLFEVATQLRAKMDHATKPVVTPIRTNGTHALTHGQQALWFLHRMNPANAVYNVAAAARIQGALDTNALEKAFLALAQRHASLRSTFDVVAGQPMQRIHEHLPLHFESIDASSWSEIDEWCAEEALRPFDFNAGPLWRVSLLKRRSDEHVLLIVAHHIIVDFWSLNVMWQELGELYTAQREERQPRLPVLESQYAGYVRRRAELLDGPEGERLWTYWQRQLGPDLPVLDLPSDRPRPPVQSHRGTAYTFKIDPALTQAIKTVAHDAGATLFATLLAAFETLLYRYSGQESFAVGSPASGRDSAALSHLVGYFVNPLVMRADFSGNPSFAELLSRVRRTALDALRHQAFPFALLVQRLQPERDLSRTPLFQTMFVFQPSQVLNSFAVGEAGSRVKLGELNLESVALTQRTTLFDLRLTMTEADDTLLASFEYSTDLFDGERIRRMAGHFETILASIVKNPQQRVSELSFLTPAEQRQLVVDWNTGTIDYPREQCMHELFEEQVARTPEATALVHDDERLSYAELNERTNRLAHYLRTFGVGPETLVGILLERSPLMIVGILGVLKAGAAYVPLDINYPRERLQYTLQDARAQVLLTQAELHSALPETEAEVVIIDERGQATLPDLFNPRSSLGRTSQEEGLAPAAQDLAYVIYTSGSTGRPKGVAIEHRSAVAFIHWAKEVFSIEHLAGLLASTSICFDLSIFEIFVPLCVGGKIIIAAQALELPTLSAAEEVTLINTVPSAMTELVRLHAVPDSVRVVNLAGEPLPNALVQSIYQQAGIEQVLNLYGPSEDTTYSTWTLVEKGSTEAPTIGRPIANTQAYLLDAHLQLVPVGVVGELCLGGHGLARGYLNVPELTAERFIPDPFSTEPGARLYRTGDLARWLPDGQLEFLGRRDHQLKLRGFRIELGEIEAVLKESRTVEDAVVIAREDTVNDVRLVAYVVGCDNTTELRDHLKQKLPHYMIPSAFVVLDKLPLSPNGKIDRRALPAPEALTPDVENDFVAPRDQREEMIAGIWAAVLNVEQVGIHQNFFDLGGHSLLATQVIARLNEAFHVDLPLRSLFESPTVAALAERVIHSSGAHYAQPIEHVARDGPLPLSFAQQRLWFLDQLEPGSAAYHVPILIRLTGPLNASTLEQSIREVVNRHESLRTTFKNVDERPVQVIAPPGSWRLNAIDLSETDEPEREALRRAKREALLPFDLSTGPLLRATLWHVGADIHILLLAMHHIVADGWSIGIFVSELSAIYNAAPLAELPCQYADFAQWQRRQLSGEALATHLDYWKQRLRGPIPPIELPSRRVRSTTNDVSAATESMPFPEELTTSLQQLSRHHGVTTFMTLLAAFQTLLHRYTGLDDIAVGTPVANRTRTETESLIGFFANTLVLRGDVSGDPSFDELLTRVRTLTLEAHAHQDVPFELLVEELQPERDLDRTPLFQIMLVMQNTPPPVIDLPGVRVEQLELETTAPKFDLVLFLKESDGSLSGSWEYNPARFDAETIRGLASHFETLLESAIADPSQRISQLNMLRDDERQLVVSKWNDTAVEYPRAAGLHKLFETQAARTPKATALVYDDERLTYEELNERANQLAHHLRGSGVGPETRVGICLERSLEMVIGLLGILKAGAAYVPLEPSYPQERLSLMIEEAGIRVVLTTQRFREILSVDAICLDADWNQIARQSKANPATNTVPGNLAYVIYTSGSTGKPKGSMITHEGICNRLLWMQDAYRLTAADRVLQKTPYTFDVSLWEFFWPLITGARLVMARPGGQGDSRYLVETIRQEKITTMHFVPSMLAVFLEEREAGECRSLKRVICSGEALSYELKEKFVKLLPAELHNLYGPTEASVDVTYWDCRSELERAIVPIGRPIANTQIYVLDKNLQVVPVGVPGELYIGGAGLARGYLNKPDLTAERFLPDPFGGARLYRTGDLARYLADGNVKYLGRTDHQVKLRGFRIELGEIEAALNEHSAVQQAVVVARDKRLVAYVVPDPQRAAPINRLLGLEAAGQLENLTQFELPNEMTIVCRNRNETEFMYEEIFADKTYLNFGIRFPNDACIFDVGANIGLFTLFASRLAPQSVIYSFEPIPPVFEILRRNAEIHAPDTKLFACGLSNVSEQASFTYYPNVSLISGRFADVVADGETVKSFVMGQQGGNGNGLLSAEQLDELIAERLTSERFTCQLKTLSEVIRAEGVEKIDLLKIDVEKAELEVLAGIDDADWPKIQQIVMEVHDLDDRVSQVTELLSGHGFAVNVQQDAMLEQTNLYNLYARRNSQTVSHEIDEPAAVVWSSRELLVKELRERLKNRLPEYMVPSAFVLLPELPTTSSGKVDRRALPDPAVESIGAHVEPRTPVEEQLAQMWEQLLNRTRVSVHQNFFELGGHSLLATQLMSRVRDVFQIELPLRSIFEAKTIAELAKRIERGTGTMSPIPRASRDTALPLSFAQQRLWFMDQVVPGNPAYNIQAAVRLSGPLSPTAFDSTLKEIVQRHEILRTTFHVREGQPTQIVGAIVELRLEIRDLSTLQSSSDAIQQLASEEARRPFDLTRGPLLRAMLLRLAETEHVLLLSVHHIVADGWSMGVLVREVATLYRAFVEGRPTPLAELPIQYADFAVWQRQWLQGEVLHEQLDYWRQQLAGLEPLELPSDYPRPPVQSFRGARRFFSLSAQISNELRALSEREGVTLYMTLLAAWQTLLHRYTGQNEIVVGTDIANRNRSEIESLIGFFTNQLVLRSNFNGNPTFRELLRRVRQITLDAYAHQDLPFEKLVETVQPERIFDRNPLFQVMFVFQNAQQLELPGLVVRALEIDEGTTAFDLTLTMEETDEGIKGSIRYSTDLFKATTIERMVQHYQNILTSLVTSIDTPVHLLEMLDPEEAQVKKRSKLKKLSTVTPRAVTVP